MVEHRITIEEIRQVVAGSLPGRIGQIEMAPQRPDGQPNRWDIPDDCREAGVLLLCYPQLNRLSAALELHLILTRRHEYPGVHSGQISFPGGRRETGETLKTTALRETMEEIGVAPNRLQVLGELSPLYTPPSNFCIYPFVAYSPVYPNFQPDPKEVAEIVEAPLSHLLDPVNRKEEIWDFEKYGQRRVPFFDVFGHKVWGATAMILSEFLMLLR